MKKTLFQFIIMKLLSRKLNENSTNRTVFLCLNNIRMAPKSLEIFQRTLKKSKIFKTYVF